MQKMSFDKNWRFKLGDPLAWQWHRPDPTTWREVELPHDWSVEYPRDPENPSGASNGFFKMGLGRYYKFFDAPEAWRDKKVFLEFEGVYMNAEVWLNGNLLGRHPYGYTSFAYDLSPYLKYGEENELYVTVDNATQRNSRWYSGSGIYRHVNLWIADPVHIPLWGVYVTTPEITPMVAAEPMRATVRARTMVMNESGNDVAATVRTQVLGPDGETIAENSSDQEIISGTAMEYSQDMTVPDPQLWSPDSPTLYQLQTEVSVAGEVVDTTTTAFGIRSLEFSAERGFLLNEQPVLLKGGCVHHDNGVMGSAAFDRSEERKVEVLKASGYNAIRCAHNPPSPAFLDACDRLGMLVIDESFDCWRMGKNTYDYHVSFPDWWQRDLDSMVLRDRNHPSIIMWSIGNEVGERAGASGGVALANAQANYIRALDPTRPITAAINGGRDRWPWEQTDGVFAALDVGGYNYQARQYVSDHERHPDRIMYGSESTAMEAFDHWELVKEQPYVIGDFVWTSLDYLGESGIGRVHFDEELKAFLGDYPWHQANCGDLDLCGFKRPQSYYRDILWERGEPLYIAVHAPVPEGKEPQLTYWGWPDVSANWTWPDHEEETFKVDVYAAADEVELFLNGESLGVQPSGMEERHIATFEVPYQAGELKAVGLRNGEPVAETMLETVGEPVALRLTPDRDTLSSETGQDLSFVTVEVVDAEGRRHPSAANEIFFTVHGPGQIAAVGNANPTSTEDYRGNQRSAHQGVALVVVQAGETPGDLRLRANADALDPAEVVITVE